MMAGFTHDDVSDQSGKTFLITGGNTGIGFETAKVLAGKNARVLIGCRNKSKAVAAIDSILKEFPQADLEFIELDLSDLESVKRAVVQVNKEQKLDVLINNAGIMVPPLERTAQGFESQFGVNHIGPFALTLLLLEKLQSSPGARVVNTSSVASRYGVINFDDLNADKNYDAMKCYSQSKLANLLFSNELSKRLEKLDRDTISVCCHPGVADTELMRHLPALLQHMTPIVRLFFNTPLKGAWPTLMAATGDQVKNGDCTGPEKRRQTAGPARVVRLTGKGLDKVVAEKLWKKSIELSGVSSAIV